MASDQGRLEALDRVLRARQSKSPVLFPFYIVDTANKYGDGQPRRAEAHMLLEQVFLELKYHRDGEYDADFVRSALSIVLSGLRDEANWTGTSDENTKKMRSLREDVESLQHKFETSREPLTHRERDFSRRKNPNIRPQDEKLKAVRERLIEIQERLHELERANVFYDG